jgi:hypothetical protein
VLARIGATTSYAVLAPVFVLIGVGNGLILAPMTHTVMMAVGVHRAGLGSAATNTAREVGGVLGIALLGTLLTGRLRASLVPGLSTVGLRDAQRNQIVTQGSHGRLDQDALAGLSPAHSAQVQHVFTDAFMAGFHLAHLVPAILLLLTAVAALVWIPGKPEQSASPAVRAGDDAEVPVTLRDGG